MFLAVLIHVASQDVSIALVLNTHYAHIAHNKMLTVMSETPQLRFQTITCYGSWCWSEHTNFLLLENIINYEK